MQPLTQFVQNNSLPIFIFLGIAGFICSLAADSIKNRALKADADPTLQELPFPEVVESKVNSTKRLRLVLNLTGFAFMALALIGLWVFGHFEPYIRMMFG